MSVWTRAISPPTRIVAAPRRVRTSSQERIGGSISKKTRISQKSPTLIITPERRAEIGEGAAGWASGSQVCIGAIPAFTPRPSRKRTKKPQIAGSAKKRPRASSRMSAVPANQ